MRIRNCFDIQTVKSFYWICAVIYLLFIPFSAAAQDSVCARVKIEIRQELTLERQAFDAHMAINNGLTNIALQNVGVDVNFTDEDGNAVLASSDPNNTTAKFFIRVDTMENINAVDGTGTVQPSSTADIHWLIIPAQGASNGLESGTLYYVGATLKYTMGGEQKTTEVSPDYIFVKPMPALTLDYFLPNDIYGDDAFTPEIEPIIPFNLGVRVRNSGAGIAKNVKIDSAQPKIVENEQGLLINFAIEGSEVNGLPATDSLLVNFGDIPTNESGTARWIMTCTLSGKFVEFTAEYSHSDELGGELTSLIDAVNTHFLLHDVLVDLPGRDSIRDFLVKDGGIYRVYESDGVDTDVVEQSSSSNLLISGGIGTLTVPVTAGFMYVQLHDPFNGQNLIKEVLRSDGKRINPANVWLSKTRFKSDPWQHFINLFDVNTTDSYRIVFEDASSGPQPPVLQFIPDRSKIEGQQISFIVEASDPNGTIPVLSASPLPAGAKFTDQGNTGNGIATGMFDWTPAAGQAGTYNILFKASDGALEDTQGVTVTVQSAYGDSDSDGYRKCLTGEDPLNDSCDCNDNDNTIYPGSPELCDNEDNNCNGQADENLTRPTICGAGECSGTEGEEACSAGAWGNNTCDPFARAVTEVCDGKDNDCDGLIDEGFDKDGDTYTTCSGDCNDSEPLVNPGSNEGPLGNPTCSDGIDNDCDGTIDLCSDIIYISPDGICGGNTPCYSKIQDGINAASYETIIKVSQGTYHENIIMERSIILGGWSSDFTKRDINPVFTVIDGGLYLSGYADSTIEGFTIQDGGISISNYDYYGYGITINLLNNIITGSDYGVGVDVYCYGSCTINLKNNIIHGHTSGLDLSAEGYLFDPDLGYCEPYGSVYLNSTNNTISDNNTGLQTSVSPDCANVSVNLSNDIVWGNNIDIDSSNGGTVKASHSDIGNISGPYIDLGNNLNEDPVFSSPASGDYRLTVDSPLINKGDNSSASSFSTDFEGDPRIYYGRVDIGADEYIGAYDYVFRILRTDVPPVMDGDLSEYKDADLISFLPLTGGNRATVRTLWDDDALYVAYEVTDTELNALVTSRDGGVWNEDSVEWAIDTLNNDGGTGNWNAPYMLPDDYHGIINIRNTRYDSRGTVSGSPASSWDGNWDSAIQLNGTNNDNTDTDRGYAVEVKIPWTAIGFTGTPAVDEMVGMGFLVNDLDAAGQPAVPGMWPEGRGNTFENAANWSAAIISADTLVHYYCDNDNDGYFDKSSDGMCVGTGCEPTGCQTSRGTDCNDTNKYINPGELEICDQIDNNCNGQIDDNSCFSGDVYVNPDSLCGGLTPCFHTIENAINASARGASIKVARGTYNENLYLLYYSMGGTVVDNFTLQGGWDTSFTIRSEDPSLTVIDGDKDGDGVSDGSVIYFNNQGGRDINVIIEGFTITHGYDGIGASSYLGGANTLTLKNIIITSCGIGIYASSGGSYLGSDSTATFTVINNVITGNSGGIEASSTDYGKTTLTLVNNTISNNHGGCCITSGIWVYSQTNSKTLVELQNNIVWGNTSSDIYIYQNNWQGSYSTATVNASYSDIGVIQNVWYRPGTYNDLGNNINALPLFADASYHISHCSVLIDAGTNNGAPSTDFEGHPRPFDADGDGTAGTDIGADEFYASTAPYGDVTGDGVVNIKDVQACIAHIVGSKDWGKAADINGDGYVNIKDTQIIAKIITDSDCDGLPNDWETANGLDPNDYGSTNPVNGPDGDPDNDTHTNIDEYKAGSNPQSSDSRPVNLDVHLYKGFNLFGYPVTEAAGLKSYDLLSMLGSSEEIEKILVFDKAAERYAVTYYEGNIPAGANVDIDFGKGITIYAKTEKTISFNSTVRPSKSYIECDSVTVSNYTNVMTFPCAPQGYTAYQLLTELSGTIVSSISRFNPLTGMLETAGYDKGSPVGVNFPIKPGEGYYIYIYMLPPAPPMSLKIQ